MNDDFYLEHFISYIKAQKGLSANTVEAYKNDLVSFTKYLVLEFSTEHISTVSHKVIRAWLVTLLDNELTARSINRKISALKTYYKFLLKNKFVHRNPMLKVIGPKAEKKLPEFISETQIENVIEYNDYENNFEGTRNQLIISLFYATGMRRAELIGLGINDFDIYYKQVKVLGKGNKQRTIPITSEIINLYKTYLVFRNEIATDCNNVFITEKGAKTYADLIHKIVTQNLQYTTTQQKKSPHVLRHTFATHMLNNGADLNAIKELLGHTSLNATQVYTHNNIEKLKAAFKQAHPRSGE